MMHLDPISERQNMKQCQTGRRWLIVGGNALQLDVWWGSCLSKSLICRCSTGWSGVHRELGCETDTTMAKAIVAQGAEKFELQSYFRVTVVLRLRLFDPCCECDWEVRLDEWRGKRRIVRGSSSTPSWPSAVSSVILSKAASSLAARRCLESTALAEDDTACVPRSLDRLLLLAETAEPVAVLGTPIGRADISLLTCMIVFKVPVQEKRKIDQRDYGSQWKRMRLKHRHGVLSFLNDRLL